jgi:hypothetical protein
MDLSEDRKCGQEEPFYHIFCHCPVLAGHRIKIFGSAQLELSYISMTSTEEVLALAMITGLF